MNIRRGDRGDEVKALQRALNAHDFNLDDDGIFGAKTEEAVKAFQRRNSLDDDGIAGQDTLRALGLDPDTLQPLSGDSSTTDEDVITFTEEDVTVPPVIKQRKPLAEVAHRERFGQPFA
jgi:peptidoglycan hydrolase-like protein with peptidoglycan-binding domain